MDLALAQAREARDAGELPIGAVVLGPDGAVLATGGNRRELAADPTAHAELVAIRRAARALGQWRLLGCTVAVTLEPCPMCAGAMWLARVDRLVYGAANPRYGAAGSAWNLLADPRLNHNPTIVGGVLGQECSQLLKGFFTDRR
jgi:tRNA(adenine34) deaminase